MQFSSLLSATTAALWVQAAVASALIPHDAYGKRQEDASLSGSSFELDAASAPLTFTYTTDSADDTNWIALWAVGDGPVDAQATAPALVWEYTPGSEGAVQLSVDDLHPGDYVAYFLAEDGYESLADPVEFAFEGLAPDLYFPVEEATLHNARQGESYVARLGGLVLGVGNGTVGFDKASGDDWLHVADDGTITGTPGCKCPEKSHAEVLVTADNGSSARLRVVIPVRRRRQPLVDRLAVMSYNTWMGGTHVHNYHEKQLRFILESGADIIGLQEAAAGDHVVRLSEGLGWHYWQSNRSVGILSRYPIVEEYGEVDPVDVPVEETKISPGGGVRIGLNGESKAKSEVNVWSAHLSYQPYGPYDFCFDNMTEEEVLEREGFSGRPGQMQGILTRLESQLADSSNVPVILVGDMNAPSHLDWIEALREKNCGIADNYPWPTSILPTDAGLIDSFRVAHADAAREQCLSWSPIYPFNEGSTGAPEPQDRIDFVYGTAELRVQSSECLVAGEPRPVPDHEDNEWTSDHLAVLTHYRLS
ncbi:uncharacterized protein HMPREF1541_04302 [Cyphellophora europaea CBS 101466]|uniref:Endonuclease/exonuclease/phosphatase domain-containing protein n=1 Tax=Cyphellophora europaea (strain CBS 101466) TaxID=1220924 RepID=W2RUB1_CYPE1|nr:uncharacterized protein HMPREF1541_04302 [Cyphellophora europaea CBS 101466]ETN40027.1 hypothetical protein HMPREF1541_04302 [Cyphellophora europaea CBS 101466]